MRVLASSATYDTDREAIDDVNDVQLRPFVDLVDSDSAWVNHRIPTQLALLIYGLIEADLRAALGPDTALPGLLPEHRDAVPTARAVLAAFTDLHATYTSGGLVLDRLTGVQRLILAHLDIPLPWSETHSTTTTFKNPDHNPQLCGKRA